MRIKDKIVVTAVILFLIGGFFYLIREIMAPFILAFVLAYFLNPLVEYFHKKYKVSRAISTSLIVGIFVVVAIALLVILVPMIYAQVQSFIVALPIYLDESVKKIPLLLSLFPKLQLNAENIIAQLVDKENMTEKLMSFSGDIVQNIVSSSAALINALSLIFVTPILVFYLLRDWDLLIKKIAEYLPNRSSSAIKKIFKDMDDTLSGYIRGQVNVCLILAVFYGISLTIIGLNFGMLIGIVTGLLTILPYIGAISGISIAAILALFQWGLSFEHALMLTVIFFVGQTLEGNFLVPKLVGSRVGLHPTLVILGLFVCGILFGFIGILLAMPLTSIAGVIVKHLAFEYKKKFV